MTSPEQPVLLVLDLTDDRGFALAATKHELSTLTEYRDATVFRNEIPATTLLLTFQAASALFASGWQVSLPAVPQQRYLAVVSEGRLTVRTLT